MKKKALNVNCRVCRKRFYVKPYGLRHGWGKYCSRRCQFEGQKKGKFIHCDVCEKQTWKAPKDFRHSKSGKLFCSKRCQTLWRNKFYSGPNHPFWIDGESAYRKILLRTGAIQKCMSCGLKDKRVLITHHKDSDRRNNKIENLIWLCYNCHYLVHNHLEAVV